MINRAINAIKKINCSTALVNTDYRQYISIAAAAVAIVNSVITIC